MKRLDARVSLPLDRFELDVGLATDGPATGVFGPSGAGKTSLLETIAGARREARGRIVYGEEVWLDSERGINVPPERRGIGYVPQEGLLFPHWSVRQNLLAGAHSSSRPGASLEDIARLLELNELLDRWPATLSGGERQRVALGRALCSHPALLLLDEPLASLDRPLRRRLLMMLRRVRSQLTVPMLLVTHDPIEVQALCDVAFVLREGRVAATGEPSRVLSDPEVFPLSELEGFVNVLPGRLVESTGRGARVALGEKGAELVTGEARAAVGDEVLIGLAANQVLIATDSPRGLSARNALAARVREIQPVGAAALVRLDLDPGLPPVVVEVTESTPADLGLELGRGVFLVIKATACRVYGGRQ